MIYKNLRNISFKMVRIILCCVLALGMVAGNGLGNPMSQTIEANAKERDEKNELQKQGCESVKADNPPDGYTEVIEGKVFSGGNSFSRTGSAVLDNDLTDFANPLPYGDTFVDTTKLNWNNPSGFIIDIKDDRFKWVSINEVPVLDGAGNATGSVEPLAPLKDALGNVSTGDPMGTGDLKLRTTGSAAPKKPIRGIFYVGPLDSYHKNINDPASDEGYTNEITPKDGAPYLYRITYLNAVILSNGTRGNLVLTMNKVQFETSAAINDANPYTPNGASYSYKKACVKIQGENELGNDTGYSFTDAYGNDLNQQLTQILTADEAASRKSAIEAKLPSGSSNKLHEDWGKDGLSIRNAIGNIMDVITQILIQTNSRGHPLNVLVSRRLEDKCSRYSFKKVSYPIDRLRLDK